MTEFNFYEKLIYDKLIPDRYFTTNEVVLHNTARDCWVSINGLVFDITKLVRQYEHTPLVKPILAEAGKDISHWFTNDNELIQYVHPKTGIKTPYLPHGPIPHANWAARPTFESSTSPEPPWWRDPAYILGHLTCKTRWIKIRNMLMREYDTIAVCEEDTIERIHERYLMYNSNAYNYSWKFEGRKLNMHKNLTNNGIPDLSERLNKVGFPEDCYIPTLMLFFKDNSKF